MPRKFTVLSIILIAIMLSAIFAFADEAALNKAEQLYTSGQYQKAVNILYRHIRIEENEEPKGYYLMAYSLYKLKRFDDANVYFKVLFSEYPGYSPTTSLENKRNKHLKHVRPEYMVKQKYTQKAEPDYTKLKVTAPPEGAQIEPDEEPSTLSIPVIEQPVAVEEVTPTAEEATAPATEEATAPATEEVEADAQSLQAKAEAEAKEAAKARAAAQARLRAMQQPAKQKAPATGSPAAMLAMLMVFIIPVAGVFLLIHLIFSFFLFKIAKKLNIDRPWMAFIPVAQMFTMVQAAGLKWWWFIVVLIFSPAIIYVWMKISDNLGMNKLLGLAIIIPVLGWLALPGILAFKGIGSAGGPGAGADASMPDLSGEPDLDLPDLDFEDDFGTDDSGGADDFGTDEGVADDFNSDDLAGGDDLGGGGDDDFGGGGDDDFGGGGGGDDDFGGDFSDDDFK